MWRGWLKRNKNRDLQEQVQTDKIAHSQRVLLEAAVATADVAHHVTARLKQSLEDAIQQFEAVAAIMRDALLVCDVGGNVKACNPAAEAIFGMPTAHLMRRSVVHLFERHGKPLATAAELWSILCADGKETLGLWGVRDGVGFPVEATTMRLDRSDGSSLMMMVIRELPKLHDGDTGSLGNYRSLFDLSFDGILVVQNQQVVAANARAGSLFGCTPEKLLSVELDRLVEETSRERVARLDDGAADATEAEIVNPDGKHLSLLMASTPISWNEQIAHLITVRDITILKKLSYHLIEDVDMICCFDQKFRITFANEVFCSYYGVSRQEIVGKDIRSVFISTERETLCLNIGRLAPERPTRRTQVQTVRDGRLRVQDWIDHACYDDSGQVVEYQRTGRDITEAYMRVVGQFRSF